MSAALGITAARPLDFIAVKWNDFGPKHQRDIRIDLARPDHTGFQAVTGVHAGTYIEMSTVHGQPIDLGTPGVATNVQRVLDAVVGADQLLEPMHGEWASGYFGIDMAEDIADRSWKLERYQTSEQIYAIDPPDVWAGRTSNMPQPAADAVAAARAIHPNA